MTYQQIQTETRDAVLTITLARPEKLNAWTPVMEKELRQAIESAEGDDAARAIVITGSGRGFCAGADMDVISGIAGNEGNDRRRLQETAPPSATLEANYERKFGYLLRCRKPVFAAINGPIAGIGVCFALFCDFRYMAEGAKMTTAFARRGLIAEHGSSWMLPRLIGPMNALDLLCSARPVLAKEVAAMGLVRELPADGFLAAVQEIAREMVHAASPRSIGVMKRQVYDSLFQTLDEAFYVADREMAASFESEDFREGVAHFLEKRRPAFTGR